MAKVPENIKRLEQLIIKARAGKHKTIDKMVQRVGYIGDLESVTTRTAARVFGVTPQALGLWYSKRGCPRNKDKTYSIPDLMAWQLKTIEDKYKSKLTPEGPSEAEKFLAQERYEKMRKVRRENDVAEGKLVDTASLDAETAEIGRVFRHQAEIIERVHGSDVGDSIRKMIDLAEAACYKLYNKKGKLK